MAAQTLHVWYHASLAGRPDSRVQALRARGASAQTLRVRGPLAVREGGARFAES